MCETDVENDMHIKMQFAGKKRKLKGNNEFEFEPRERLNWDELRQQNELLQFTIKP